MHTEHVNLIADQEIRIRGKLVNIHDIKSIEVNGEGVIVNAFIELEDFSRYEYPKGTLGWLFPVEGK